MGRVMVGCPRGCKLAAEAGIMWCRGTRVMVLYM